MRLTTLLPVLITAITPALAGPAAYGLCQTGCAGVVMACYSAAGFTWGATLSTTAPATVLGYNAAYGGCQATCAALLLAPTL